MYVCYISLAGRAGNILQKRCYCSLPWCQSPNLAECCGWTSYDCTSSHTDRSQGTVLVHIGPAVTCALHLDSCIILILSDNAVVLFM